MLVVITTVGSSVNPIVVRLVIVAGGASETCPTPLVLRCMIPGPIVTIVVHRAKLLVKKLIALLLTYLI